MPLIVSQGFGEVSASAFVLSSVVANGVKTIVTFTQPVIIDGPALDPANWIITGGPGPVTVLTAVAVGTTVELTTTDQQTGTTYTLHLPFIGIRSSAGFPLNGAFSMNFTGVGLAVAVNMVRAIDERLLDVVFNQPVLEVDAIDPTKYSVSPPLTIYSSYRVTDQNYRLVTGPQPINQAYAMTIGPIRDINGNL